MTIERKLQFSTMDPSEVERLRSVAFSRLEYLLDYSEYDSDFAREMVSKIIDRIADDETFVSIIHKRLGPERIGKTSGAQRKWTDVKLLQVFAEYLYWERQDLPEGKKKSEREILDLMATNCGYDKDNHNRRYQIKEKIERGKELAEGINFTI